MGWWQRRREDDELVALARHYGPAFMMVGDTRAELVAIGRQLRDMQATSRRVHDAMREVGYVETFDGEEVGDEFELAERLGLTGPPARRRPRNPAPRPKTPAVEAPSDVDDGAGAVADALRQAAESSQTSAENYRANALLARAAGDIAEADRLDTVAAGYADNALRARRMASEALVTCPACGGQVEYPGAVDAGPTDGTEGRCASCGAALRHTGDAWRRTA
jgi:hypothetical protein